MNPVKLWRLYELKKWVEIKAKLQGQGLDSGYVDRKIADLQAKVN